VREAVRHAPGRVLDVYLTEAALERHGEIWDEAVAVGLYVHVTTQQVMDAMSPDAQGLLAVVATEEVTGSEALTTALEGARLVAVLTQAQAAREEAQSLHDLLERRRALVEEKQRLAERAEQEATDAQRLQDAERASRVRPYLIADQGARSRAQQAVAALAARADQSGLAHLAEQAGVTSAGSMEDATGSDAHSRGAEVTPAALVEPLVREAQRQLADLEDEPSEARAGAAEAGAQIFEQSPMTRIEPHQGGWLVHTPDGSIECQNLVYAVNTYAGLHNKFKTLEKKAIAISTSL